MVEHVRVFDRQLEVGACVVVVCRPFLGLHEDLIAVDVVDALLYAGLHVVSSRERILSSPLVHQSD